MNCLPAGERLYWSLPSKNWLRPSLNSDMCVCIPEPFSPKSGFGMNVA